MCDFYKLLDAIITNLSFICHERRFWFISNLQLTFLFKIHGYAQTDYLINIDFSTIESKISTYFITPMKIWTFGKLRPVKQSNESVKIIKLFVFQGNQNVQLFTFGWTLHFFFLEMFWKSSFEEYKRCIVELILRRQNTCNKIFWKNYSPSSCCICW